jgi:hypothetical protein
VKLAAVSFIEKFYMVAYDSYMNIRYSDCAWPTTAENPVKLILDLRDLTVFDPEND